MAKNGIQKIKNLRGSLYRKLSKKKGESEKKKSLLDTALPGFKIQKTEHIVEFPSTDDVTKIDFTYPLMEPFAYANIKWVPEERELVYMVIEPKLDKKEEELLKKISKALIELVEVELSSIKREGKVIEYLEAQIKRVIKDFEFSLTGKQYIKIMYYVYRNFIGFNEIEPLLEDPNIEDISCDGTNIPLYVIHRKFGSIKTNIIIEDLEYLREFVIKLAERAGRYVSYAEPILDGTLPDGSRISATLAGDVATRGPTFTIRKFSEKPFSPIDQIKMNTASSEMLAYYWYMVEHGISMLFVGGVATGKTSFLNTICMFIPPEAKVVSIEDTRELRIPNEHWVPSLARSGFGIPMPTGEKYGGVSLYDLLKESFRQNPDYVIVGETRGKEAYVMFQGMSSGHPSMSTFHAGSVDTVIKRLTTPPIELSPTLIESLNIITIMVHARSKGKSARRIREVVEIESVDPKTEEVSTNSIFRWEPSTDTYKWVNKSIMLERLVHTKGGDLEEAYAEIERRRRILDWMDKNEITDYKEVTDIINRYYKEPEGFLKEIGISLSMPKVEIPVSKAVEKSVKLSVPTGPKVTPQPKMKPPTATKETEKPVEERPRFKEKAEEPVKPPETPLAIPSKLKEEELISILSLLSFDFLKKEGRV
jgi:flagellar protein FlaI